MRLCSLLSGSILLIAGCDRPKVDPRIFSYIAQKNRAEALGKEYLNTDTNAYSRTWLSFNDAFPFHVEQFGLTLDKTTKSWETVYGKSGLWWNRYLVTLSIPLSISSNLSSIQEKPIKVQVTQLKRVFKQSDGQFSFDFLGSTLELNQKEWAQLSTNPLSLAKFGMIPITNEPVPMVSKLLEFYGAPPR